MCDLLFYTTAGERFLDKTKKDEEEGRVGRRKKSCDGFQIIHEKERGG
jgi:hypothetical protein